MPAKIIKVNVELIDSKSIANAFNDFFANIGNELANSIPPVNKSPLNYLAKKSVLSISYYI